MRKRELDMLEKVFAAEVNGCLPFQTKSKIAGELVESGHLLHGKEIKSGVIVAGYYLTHAGRYAYYASC